MSQYRIWTEYEDLILKNLKKQNKKWKIVAQKMTTQFNLPYRTDQQCQQRYQTLFQGIQQSQWTFQQQKMLYELHNQLGNKWGIIGQKIMGRSDNQVKNHLYSKLRKSLRKLNKIIKQNYKKQFKQIRQNIICKIIEGAQDKFKNIPLLQKQVSEYCTQLKNKMIYFSYDNVNVNPLADHEVSQVQIKMFIEELIEFAKEYKRKPKHVRRASGQQLDINLIPGIDLLNVPLENKKIKSTGHSEVSSDSDSDQMKEFNMGSIKIPEGLVEIGQQFNNTNLNKQLKSNIILKLPQKCEMQDQTSQVNSPVFFQNQNINNQNFQSFIPQNDILFQNNCFNSGHIWNGFGKEIKRVNSGEMIDQSQLQSHLQKLGITEENPFISDLRKFAGSKKSSFSSYLQTEQPQQNFFNDDSYRMRIKINGSDQRKIWNLSSVQNSDKLFKSNDKDINNEYFAMISSVESKIDERMVCSLEKE